MIQLSIIALLLTVADYFVLLRYLKVEKNKKFYGLYAAKIMLQGSAMFVLSRHADTAYNALMMVHLSLLALIAIEDAISMQIDRLLSMLLLALGTVTALFVPGGTAWKIMLFAAVLSGVMYLFSVKSNDAVGKGDVICVGACALCFSFQNVFALMIYTLLSCLLYGTIQVLCKKISAKQGIPFIPFLVIGTMLTIALR